MPAPDLERAETVEKSHGRIETRCLESTASLAAHLRQWPGVQQVCRIERRRIVRGEESREVVYAITSLPRERATAARLLTLCRDHWRIENRLHWVRDVTCREDACRTASGHAPQLLAALRNTALTILRRLGLRPVEGFEHFAENRTQLLNILTQRRTE